MDTETIASQLRRIEKILLEQGLLQKEILNFREAARYLDISESHLYKLTSQKLIPHYCPNGKRLYFNRAELDAWLQRNRQVTVDETEVAVANYLMGKR